MFLIPQQVPWTQQPQVATGPSKLIAGTVACSPVVGLESVARQTTIGSPSRLITKDGIARTFAANQWVSVDHGYKSNAYTLIAICPLSGSVGESHLLDDDDVGAGVRSFQLRVVGLDVQFIAFNNEPSVLDSLSVNLNPTLSKKFYVVVARASSAKQALDVSGCPATSQAALSRRNLSGNVLVGGFKGDINAQNTDGVLGYAVVPRYMSDAEVKRILDNPWEIFTPQIEYTFIPSIAGGGPANITGTLSSTLDSITTVIQGSLGHSGSLSVSLDTITVTGNGVLNHIGTGAFTLDDVVVTFNGAVDTAGSVSGTLACTLDNIVFSGAGNLNHSTTINLTLDDIFVSLAGTVAGTPENIDGTISIMLDGIGFTSSGNSGTLTLTEDDINAIMTAIINNPKTLTVPKFLGLK